MGECKDIVSKLQINVDKAQAAAESSRDILESLNAELNVKTRSKVFNGSGEGVRY
jgi:hypothetical protein